MRGASWATLNRDHLLASCRLDYPPGFRNDRIGFRCVVAAELSR
jgi:formylglycine-generating enzyme required for sulfatase activity